MPKWKKTVTPPVVRVSWQICGTWWTSHDLQHDLCDTEIVCDSSFHDFRRIPISQRAVTVQARGVWMCGCQRQVVLNEFSLSISKLNGSTLFKICCFIVISYMVLLLSENWNMCLGKIEKQPEFPWRGTIPPLTTDCLKLSKTPS